MNTGVANARVKAFSSAWLGLSYRRGRVGAQKVVGDNTQQRLTHLCVVGGCFPNRFIKINAIGTGGLAIKRKAHSEALRARTCSESATPRFGGEPYIKPRFLTRKMKNIFEFIGSFFGGFVGSFFSAFFSFLLGFINGLLGLFFGLFF